MEVSHGYEAKQLREHKKEAVIVRVAKPVVKLDLKVGLIVRGYVLGKVDFFTN